MTCCRDYKFYCIPLMSIAVWLVDLLAYLPFCFARQLTWLSSNYRLKSQFCFIFSLAAWNLSHMYSLRIRDMCRIHRIWCFSSLYNLLTRFSAVVVIPKSVLWFTKQARLQVFCLGFSYPNQLGPALWLKAILKKQKVTPCYSFFWVLTPFSSPPLAPPSPISFCLQVVIF